MVAFAVSRAGSDLSVHLLVRAKVVNVPDMICLHIKLVCVSQHQTFEHLVLGQFGSLCIELMCISIGILFPICSTKLYAAVPQQM